MKTPKQIAEDFGLVNVDHAIAAAEKTGYPLHAAFALLEMESKGKNIFGQDAGGMYIRQAVTKEKFDKLVAAVKKGAPTNGVGPMQITYAGRKRSDGTRDGGFFRQAEEQGLRLWLPAENMEFGFKVAAGYRRRYPNSWYSVGRLYNGKESYGTTYARKVGEWKNRLAGAQEEETEMAWNLAPALVQLRSEIDKKWPGRDKSTDGALGDQAHAARKSEHNPEASGTYKGRVNAIDVDTSDIDFSAILPKLKADKRTWYVIHKGYIYSRTYNFAKRRYTGSNPHNGHFHISIYPGRADGQSKASWGIAKVAGGSTTGDKKLPTLSVGESHDYLVPVLNRFFGIRENVNDPKFSSGLANVVKQYQRTKGLERDGVVGPLTWGKILAGLTLPGWKI